MESIVKGVNKNEILSSFTGESKSEDSDRGKEGEGAKL